MLPYRNLERPWLISTFLVVAVLAAYLPVYFLDFINFDDPLYVYHNRHVQAGLTTEGWRWAFTQFHAANWHPLTWLSHMLDCQLYGLRPLGHHVTNVLLHAANAVILFLWLRSLTGATWRSALVAALFALHPLRVESVAWVAERKDVLSAFFGLLCLWAYTKYASRAKDQDIRTARSRLRFAYYGLSLLLFALGLLSKPMLVTWPFLLLLLDYWPLARLAGAANVTKGAIIFDVKLLPMLVMEKLLFFALATGSCVVTFFAQRSGGAVSSIGGDYGVTLAARLSNVPISYVRYVFKLLWPQDLAIIYPLIRVWPEEQVAVAVLVLLAATGLVLWRGRCQPYLAMGWFWFLGTAVPVIGLVQVGTQSVADRYTYIPAIGLFILLAWSLGDVANRWRNRVTLLSGTAIAVLLAFTYADGQQLLYWQNSEALFRHTLAVTRNNYMAYLLLGSYYSDLGDLEPAKAHYHAALTLAPELPNAWNNLGCALVAQKQFAEATEAFQKVLRITPGAQDAHSNLGNALFGLGRIDEALQEYREAVRLVPDNGLVQFNLANILWRKNQAAEALEHARLAVKFAPQHVDGHVLLANLLMQQGNTTEAAEVFRRALAGAPRSMPVLYAYAVAMSGVGNWDEAARLYDEILHLAPGDDQARLQLGMALAAQGKLNEALDSLSLVLHNNPTNAAVNYHVAATLASQHKFTEAISHYRTAIGAVPAFPEALNNLAWILAANPDPGLRNGHEAVKLAERACELTQYQQALIVGTLAAAYAEAGNFKAAVTTAEKAKALSDAAGDKEVSAKNAELLELYRSEKPYRDTR